MDTHFKTADFDKIPVILALSVWYNNFFGAESEALIPLQYLQKLAPYLPGNHGGNGKV
jgi:glucose-6-phosphate isomerase